MNDNVKFVLDADIAKAEAQLDRLTARIANIQERLRSGERAGDTEKAAGAIESMARSAASFAAGMVGAQTVMQGIRAVAAAITADMERIRSLGQEAGNVRAGAAGARAQALREGLGIFGSADAIDRLARQAAGAGIPLTGAYETISLAASVGGGMSPERLAQVVLQSSRTQVADPSFAGPGYVGSLVRGARLFDRSTVGRVAGYMSQFAQTPAEMSSLAGIMETARAYGADMHHAAGLFGRLADVSDDAGAAQTIVQRILTGASGSDALPSGTEMVEAGRIQGGGIRWEPRPRRVPVTGTSLRDRLKSIATIFGAEQTTEDQRGDILRTFAGGGARSPEGSLLRTILESPDSVDAFFSGIESQPRVSSSRVDAVSSQLRAAQAGGLGVDLTAESRTRSVNELMASQDAVGAARERLRAGLLLARNRGDMSIGQRAFFDAFVGGGGPLSTIAGPIRALAGTGFEGDTENVTIGAMMQLQKQATATNEKLTNMLGDLLAEFRRARTAAERASYDAIGPGARSSEPAFEAVGN